MPHPAVSVLRAVIGVVLAAILLTGPTRADNTQKVAYMPATPGSAVGAHDGDLVLSAPPRESLEDGQAIYDPIAKLLTQTLGRKVVYQHPGTWGVYQGTMQKNGYDLVLDGAHFNGWRIEKLGHNVLVKVPGEYAFVTIVAKDSEITASSQLVGRTICAHAPPNFATLVMLTQFKNPARQPVIVLTEGWKAAYDGLRGGRCRATVLPARVWEQYDTGGAHTRVVARSATYPDNALSASPRLSPGEQVRVAQALLSPEGQEASTLFRQRYASGRALVPAQPQEFTRLGQLLAGEWGYY